MVVVAQLVRAPDCGSGGRRFETDLPPKIKAFQLSERLLLYIVFLDLVVTSPTMNRFNGLCKLIDLVFCV